ncbi:DUF885 family protein [Deinococcus ruber]|uniref:DUF885 domain-containing protein n=1 Tax=Deinococcus ruber TaxID=1848197 RepID=A0A918F5F3_9DEIO|nr:DUF885 family protein [Deinococcus ruber]GGR06214.1 hypothetical protein GCM10008957_18750 [Deinococcus ruber]
MSLEHAALVEQYLQWHAWNRPVDATFMGLPGHDHRLPPVGTEAEEREQAALREMQAALDALPEPDAAAVRQDAWLLRSQLRVNLEESRVRPRQDSPAWYSGEAAFAVISLLLPSPQPRSTEDLRRRLEDIPAFLAAGTKRLAGRNLPADWVERAVREAHALSRLLTDGLPQHPLWSSELAKAARAASQAALAYADSLHPGDADPASGAEYLAFLMREAHALPYSPTEAEALAEAAFYRLLHDLEEQAHQLDPQRSWREQLAALEELHPELDDVQATYEAWNQRALSAARGLVTPAKEYGLSFQWLPEWARAVAGDLYFLFYRSPAALHPGAGSVYWVFPPGSDTHSYLRGQNTAFIKLVHAVHHGSVGHHTQNARARNAASTLARFGGTDCAAGIAFLSAGTLVEGWACYAEDLLLESPGFYTPQERLLLTQFELRNAACCLADIRLHTGVWSLEQMRAFYRDEVGFAPARIWAETTRNSLYPATRLMYWLGTQAIRELRAELPLPTQDFHDRVLSYGSTPIYWIAAEMRRALQPHS